MDKRSRAMPENASPLTGLPTSDAPAGQPLQTAAVVSTQSVVGPGAGPVGSQPNVADAPTGLPSVTMPPGDLPDAFGRYRVQKKLGSGAMGAVYLAEDTLLQRKVAIKTPTFENDRNGELLRRFYREARAVAKDRYPSIKGGDTTLQVRLVPAIVQDATAVFAPASCDTAPNILVSDIVSDQSRVPAADARAQIAAHPQPFEGYEIIQELGRGGMGIVYRARAKADGSLVALKVILPALYIVMSSRRIC